MNPIDLNYTIDLAKRETQLRDLDQILHFGDENAYKFNISILRNGEPEDLTGMSCTGYIVHEATNKTHESGTSSITGNVASVLLDEDSCQLTGRVYIIVKLVKPADNFILTVFTTYGDVVNGITGDIFITPGSRLDPDTLDAKIQEIEDIIERSASVLEDIEEFDETIDTIVLAQDTQPVEERNKIWFPDPTPEGIEIPTFEDVATKTETETYLFGS